MWCQNGERFKVRKKSHKMPNFIFFQRIVKMLIITLFMIHIPNFVIIWLNLKFFRAKNCFLGFQKILDYLRFRFFNLYLLRQFLNYIPHFCFNKSTKHMLRLRQSWSFDFSVLYLICNASYTHSLPKVLYTVFDISAIFSINLIFIHIISTDIQLENYIPNY